VLEKDHSKYLSRLYSSHVFHHMFFASDISYMLTIWLTILCSWSI